MKNCLLILFYALTSNFLEAKNTHWALETGLVYPHNSSKIHSSSLSSNLSLKVITPYNLLKSQPYLYFGSYKIDEIWKINDYGLGVKLPLVKNIIADLRFMKFETMDISNPYLSSIDLELYNKVRTKYFNLFVGPTLKILMSENQTDIFPGVAFSIGYKLTKGYTSKNKKEKKKLELNENKVNLENKINGSRATGNLKIDNFVNASFDLNDKVVDLKEKLNSVSDTLNESNKVLTEISKGSKGAWKVASNEVVKEFYKSKKNIISAAQLINSNVPNLPQLYFILLKEAMMDPNTLKEFAKGSELEEALLLTFNNKAKKKGMPTISKEWINNLNLKLDPTKALESKLRKIKKK